jgi:cytochrome c oxidase subunit IV
MADSHASTTPAVSAEPHAHHGHDDAAHVAKHIRGYLFVGALLLVFTLITVGLSYIDFDKMFGGHGWNMIIGMLVATFKASLVAAIFMHLKGERATIWRFLIFTVIFAAGLFLLTLLHEADPIMGTQFNRH